MKFSSSSVLVLYAASALSETPRLKWVFAICKNCYKIIENYFMLKFVWVLLFSKNQINLFFGFSFQLMAKIAARAACTQTTWTWNVIRVLYKPIRIPHKTVAVLLAQSTPFNWKCIHSVTCRNIFTNYCVKVVK